MPKSFIKNYKNIICISIKVWFLTLTEHLGSVSPKYILDYLTIEAMYFPVYLQHFIAQFPTS